jgi:hypothetical protein
MLLQIALNTVTVIVDLVLQLLPKAMGLRVKGMSKQRLPLDGKSKQSRLLASWSNTAVGRDSKQAN